MSEPARRVLFALDRFCLRLQRGLGLAFQFDDTLAKPSFDCRTAKLPSETAICLNRRLARHEASLSKLYFETITMLPQNQKEEFRAQQRAWLKYRDTCAGSDVENCLLQRMADRRNEIIQLKLRQ